MVGVQTPVGQQIQMRVEQLPVQFVARQATPSARTEDTQHRFGVLHCAYLPVICVSGHLAPFALRPAFPASLAGRYSCDYYGASVTSRTRVLRVIPRSSSSYVLARLRRPIHLLESPHWGSLRIPEIAPATYTCRRRIRHRFQASFRRMMSCIFWRLGFRQSSFRHITRVPQRPAPYAWTRPPLSWQATVPVTLRIKVSHQTQKPPSEFLPAPLGI